MITIEQIKDKLIELGFEVDQNTPKFDEHTGNKLPQPTKKVYRSIINNSMYKVTINLNERYGSNGILHSQGAISLYIEDKDIPSDIYWNLFLQLLEEQTK